MTPQQQAIQDWQEEGQFKPNQYPLGSSERFDYEEEALKIINADLSNLWDGRDGSE